MNLKDKTAIVYDRGIYMSLAARLARDFGRVLLYNPAWKTTWPRFTDAQIGAGLLENEGVERIENFFDHLDEADIIVFPDTLDADLVNHLRGLGKRVWGSGYAESLELDRIDTLEYLKELNLPVPKYKVINGLDALREYLKSHEDVYVKVSIFRGTFETFHSETYNLTEPLLDKLEGELGPVKNRIIFSVFEPLEGIELAFDGFSIDGQFPKRVPLGFEVKDMGWCATIKDYKDLYPAVKEFNKAIAPTLKLNKYRNFMSPEIRVTKDGTGYMCDFCFSDDTEVLTNEGWKLFKDCTVENTFATLKEETNEIEYQHATDYITNEYNGKMILISNLKKSIECLVTPNHLVYRTDQDKSKKWKEKADSLTGSGFIPRTGIWKGGNDNYFELPEYHNEWDFVNHRGGEVICTKIKHEPAIKIILSDWANFLAWFLAEGSTSDKYVTQISQVTHVEELRKVIDKLPFKYSYDGAMFRISSIQLTTYLKKYGLCDKKYIPRYILDASYDVIRAFLDNYILADGSIEPGGKRSYRTTSKELIDGLQECIFKTGSVGNIWKSKRCKGTPVLGFKKNKKIYIRNHDCYTINERQKFTDFYFETYASRKDRYIKEVDYTGKVYCLTVPNGLLYVRRNGKPFWSSNCARFPSPVSEVYYELIGNFSEIIWAGADGELVEPEYVDEYAMTLAIYSDWAKEQWQGVYIEKEALPYVKLRNYTIVDNVYYIVANTIDKNDCIGVIVATGNSLEDCAAKVNKYADMVKGYRIKIECATVDKMQKVIDSAKEFGVSF